MDRLLEEIQRSDLQWEWHYDPLIFKRPAKTSRDVLLEKPTWYIRVKDSRGSVGLGEASIIEGLSVETRADIEKALRSLSQRSLLSLDKLPALVFGLEMALSDLQSKSFAEHYRSPFLSAQQPIPINGLIWMGDKDYMLQQIQQKIQEGFACIKLKIGGIDFEEELSLLRYIRERFGRDQIELRLDANGAFPVDQALERLTQLSSFDIHSIEQPIRQGQAQAMSALCKQSPIPVALDEELIGVNDRRDKEELLQTIQPPYIILKPSLLGGWESCDEWIALAESLNINYWTTSALESNIGLNAIAQWVAAKSPSLWQGLGTGALFENNIDSPLQVDSGNLVYTSQPWDESLIEQGWPKS